MSKLPRQPKAPKATLSKGRKSLCVIFSHPLRPRPDGKPGLRVRRGLGTKDKDEANLLIENLNILLAEPEWHTPSAAPRARARFGEIVAAAFYDELIPEIADPWQIRENLIKLPTKADGYCRVRLLGTTGAGKTTLLRQMIGTKPRERFPSTSTAKTTTCDIEVVMRPGQFEAVVTFIPMDHVRVYIEECVLKAAITALNKPDDISIAKDLLEHTEQRFRLKYLLGSLRAPSTGDLIDDEDAADTENQETEDAIGEEERGNLEAYLKAVVDKIRTVSHSHLLEIEILLGFKFAEASPVQAGEVFEEFEQLIQNSEDFLDIVDDLLNSVERRFEMFGLGDFKEGATDWPDHWTFKTADRAAFLGAVRWFTSNHAGHFGKLLTPLVSGIRVAGPFQSSLAGGNQKLVVMDSEGLGHKAATVTSISIEITKRNAVADTILLVDNAAQPMQNAPCALMKNLLVSGQEHKLGIVFTHFDQVKGLNLPDVASRKEHLLGSVHNAVESVAEGLGEGFKSALRNQLEQRVIFLTNIQNEIGNGAKLTCHEFARMFEIFRRDIVPVSLSEIHPVYDEAFLIIVIQAAIYSFRDPWRGRLGLSSSGNVAKQHFTRIKALARRFAHLGQMEYDTLKPVADLVERLKEYVAVFLARPDTWEPENAPENLKREAIAQIQRALAERLMEFSISCLRDGHIHNWCRAYGHGGIGSAKLRAQDIENIFDQSTPLFNMPLGASSIQLFTAVRAIIRDAVKIGGGSVKGVP